MSNAPSPDHSLSAAAENVHVGVWDNSIDPVLTVDPGDVVRFECRDAADGHFGPDATTADLATKPDVVHPLTGPVAVTGAEPGDALVVDLLDFTHHGFGVTYVYPGTEGMGLLPEEFSQPGLHAWDLDGDVGHFVDGIEVPLDPFPGTVGVAPAEAGEHSTVPPRCVGGNLDVKHLTAGSRVVLPVEVAGALLSVGDCHAAQGDGEVCVTGIEAPMTVTARVGLRRGGAPGFPRFETDGPFTPTGADERMRGTIGVASDPRTAARRAVRETVGRLHAERGLSRMDAYILCSAVVDLKLNQVVNEPNVTVSAYLPESIFPGSE